MTVAALYIDPRGPYATLQCDKWSADRNATLYRGPGPIVAHPPCGPWGRLRSFSTRDDPWLAAIAVCQVRRWGGVLEHPASSLLWRHMQLPPGDLITDEYGGWTMTVHLNQFGACVRKPTRLYFVRCAPLTAPPPAGPVTHVIETRARTTGHHLPSLPKSQRHLTPEPMARWLLAAAAQARPSEAGQPFRGDRPPRPVSNP